MTARGEGHLMVGAAGEDEIDILFTNRALAQVEVQLSKTVLQLADDAASGNLGIGDVARLLLAGMQAARREYKTGGKSLGMRDAFDVMDEVGFTETARVVFEALAAVLGYDREGDGEEIDEDPPE